MSRMRFGVFMVEKIQMVCLDISGSLTSGYQRFRGTQCLNLQAIYWRYVTEKRWCGLPGHTLTSKTDNICFRLCYNAIHIAICVLQPWHRRKYRVSVFSIIRKLKKQSTYPLDHYTIFSIRQIFFDIIHTSRRVRLRRSLCHFAMVSSLTHSIWIIRNTINMQSYYLASPSFTYIPTVIQTKDKR